MMTETNQETDAMGHALDDLLAACKSLREQRDALLAAIRSLLELHRPGDDDPQVVAAYAATAAAEAGA